MNVKSYNLMLKNIFIECFGVGEEIPSNLEKYLLTISDEEVEKFVSSSESDDYLYDNVSNKTSRVGNEESVLFRPQFNTSWKESRIEQYFWQKMRSFIIDYISEEMSSDKNVSNEFIYNLAYMRSAFALLKRGILNSKENWYQGFYIDSWLNFKEKIPRFGSIQENSQKDWYGNIEPVNEDLENFGFHKQRPIVNDYVKKSLYETISSNNYIFKYKDFDIILSNNIRNNKDNFKKVVDHFIEYLEKNNLKITGKIFIDEDIFGDYSVSVIDVSSDGYSKTLSDIPFSNWNIDSIKNIEAFASNENIPEVKYNLPQIVQFLKEDSLAMYFISKGYLPINPPFGYLIDCYGDSFEDYIPKECKIFFYNSINVKSFHAHNLDKEAKFFSLGEYNHSTKFKVWSNINVVTNESYINESGIYITNFDPLNSLVFFTVYDKETKIANKGFVKFPLKFLDEIDLKRSYKNFVQHFNSEEFLTAIQKKYPNILICKGEEFANSSFSHYRTTNHKDWNNLLIANIDKIKKYAKSPEYNRDMFIKYIAQFSRLFIQIMPCSCGSAAIGEWLMNGMAKSKGITLGNSNHDICSWDFAAFSESSPNIYADHFTEFFVDLKISKKETNTSKPDKKNQSQLESLESFLNHQKDLAKPLEEKKENKKITKKEDLKLRHLHLLIDEAENKLSKISKKPNKFKK